MDTCRQSANTDCFVPQQHKRAKPHRRGISSETAAAVCSSHPSDGNPDVIHLAHLSADVRSVWKNSHQVEPVFVDKVNLGINSSCVSFISSF